LHDLGSTPTFIGHVVASLDKMLYDDYLLGGFEQAANSEVRSQKKQPKSSEMDNS